MLKILSVLHGLEQAYKRKYDFFTIDWSAPSERIIKFLLNHGFIKGFKFFDEIKQKRTTKKIKIYLPPFRVFGEDRYNRILHENIGENNSFSMRTYQRLEIISKPSYVVRISLFDLKKMLRINYHYILLTDKGILLDYQAVKLKVGGILLCKIFIF